MKKILVLGLLAVCGYVVASPVSLGVAGAFNAFALGNFTSSGSDTEGAVAALGNVKLTNYSVNLLNQAGYAGDSLVVGGNLIFNGGTIEHGNAYVAGIKTISNLTFPGSFDTRGAPFAFGDQANTLTSLSASLATAVGNGNTSFNPWGGVTFTGDGTTNPQVFRVAGAGLLQVNSIALAGLHQGDTLIFDISGSQAGFKNVGMSDFANYNVLFNFFEAIDLKLDGVGVFGSILATKASINGGSGVVNGNVVVNNWNSNLQINRNHLFVGTDVAFPTNVVVQAVPEPGTLALLIPALWMLWSSIRRYARRHGTGNRTVQ